MEEKLFNGFAFSCKSIVFLRETFAFSCKTFVMEVIQVGRKTVSVFMFLSRKRYFCERVQKHLIFFPSISYFFPSPCPPLSAPYFSVFHVLKWKDFSLFSGCVWLNRSSHVVASYPDNQTHLPFISSLQCDALQVNKMYFHLIIIKS